LERSLKEHQEKFDVKVIVAINPGNPTGQVLTKENIENIIKFAYKNNLFIFADEVWFFLKIFLKNFGNFLKVYQENVYAEGAKFYSFRKIMKEMGSPYDKLELASFYSCSKVSFKLKKIFFWGERSLNRSKMRFYLFFSLNLDFFY